MTRLSSHSLEFYWGTCLCKKCSGIERELSLINSRTPTCATTRQGVPQTCQFICRSGLLACFEPALSLARVFCTLLLKPCWSHLGSIREMCSNRYWGPNQAGIQLQKQLRENMCVCVANVSGCRNALMHWLFLGKLRGTISLKPVAAVEAATVAF